ncbi:MAG: NUDIX domain-containing protein [Chloroflexi bacterium]|nr:NUDIX domain-containing protein [Chloroflexota bacterium]
MLDNQEPKYYDATGAPIYREPDSIAVGTNGIVFNEQGHVLLQRRADVGFWELPGGKVDPGETVEQGAVREVLEETNLHVEIVRFVGVYSDPAYCIFRYPDGSLVHYVTLLFECRRLSGELRISDESTDIGYFPTDDLPPDTLVSQLILIQDTLAHSEIPFVK